MAAGAATLVLRPRGGLIQPAAVDPTAYFSSEQLRRADDFREVQRLIVIGGLAVSGGTLALLALRPPRRLRRLLERAGSRPLVGGALAAAGISVILAAVDLPLSLWSHERAVEVGLSTQSLGGWLWDLGKTTAIGAVFAAGGGVAAVALMRRFPRRWWIPAAALVTGFAILVVYVQPVLIDPLFNRFEPLPRGELRSEVLSLAEAAGVDVGEVYRVDASRRTTAINAYVGGLGQTKRVVLYDNLIDDFPADQVRSVVAHELAHVKHRDLPRGLLWIAIVAPAGTLLVQRLTERLASRHGLGAGAGASPGPALLPALALSVGIVSFALWSAGNTLSRRVEARADAFALELTHDTQAFIGLGRNLALRNLGDPDPPALFHFVFGTHPTTTERIGYGEAARASER